MRSDVSKLVLAVIRKIENDPNISENTRFWEDLRVDHEARRSYFRPIQTKVKAAGCNLSKVSPQDFEDAMDVKRIVDVVWAGVKEDE
jgi:hypothetical protein